MTQSSGQPAGTAAQGLMRAVRRVLGVQSSETPPARPQYRREQLGSLHARWQIIPQPAGASRPVIGRVVGRFRGLWNFVITRVSTAHILQQQMDFNGTVVRYTQQADDDLRALEATIADIDRTATATRRGSALFQVQLAQDRRRVAELERELTDLRRTLAHRIDLLSGDLAARLDRLERRTLDGGEAAAPAVPPSPPRSDIPAMDYLRFEQRFRGPSEQVRAQQRDYLKHFAGASDVLDIGCGRGEFLEMLRGAGISCLGVDLDADMVGVCRDKGLAVVYGDALDFLRQQPEGSLGGVFSAQLVEHLTPAQLVEMVGLLGRALRPGAPVVIETINPMSLIAASSHFLLDLSHTRLVHPEALRFLLECAGFGEVQVVLRSPAPTGIQMEKLPWPGDADVLDEWATVMNHNIERVNDFLYGYQDYALVARRLDAGQA